MQELYSVGKVGSSYLVPLPPDTPLRDNEGVRWIINAIPPNLNPNKADVFEETEAAEACAHHIIMPNLRQRLLEETYLSILNTFVNIIKSYDQK